MANRRMFSLSVVDTDKFLEMPASTQALYFHLGMRADDDGFVSSPRKVLSFTNCTNDDLKVLISKGFIIPFESGIIVITHWKRHNYIQSDRYRKTIHSEERKQLELVENVYKFNPNCIQNVSEAEAQYRLSKDRVRDRVRDRDTGESMREGIDEDKFNKKSNKKSTPEIEKENRDKRESIDYQQIADMYNDTCVSFPRITKLSDARKKAIKARLNKYSLDDFKKLFEMAEASSFLKGENGRNWSANFDWMMKDANFAKILDGNYQDKDFTSGKDKHEEENPYENWKLPSYYEGLKGRKPRPDDPFQ